MLVLVAVVTRRATRPVRELSLRLACSAVAGLSTGFLAGGQVFALRGTPWPINADHGDNGALGLMSREAIATGSTHSVYPPAIPYVMAYATQQLDLAHPALVLKPLFIGLVAVTGPAAYLAWRLSLGPLAALAVAEASVLPQTAPYKPYSSLVLVLVVPLSVVLLLWLRDSARLSARAAVVRGALLGFALGVLFLIYSGWLVWCAPGVGAAVVAAWPWRRGREAVSRAAMLLVSAAGAFVLVAARYLWVLLHGLGLKDPYCSPITLTQPAYIGPNAFATTQWDQPGEWPPLGWFAGLDLVTIVLLAGRGTAVALGLRRPMVSAPVAIFAGAWLLRFWIAHDVERDRATQLFPRTTAVLQVCLCVLVVVAGLLVAEQVRSALRSLPSSERLATSAAQRSAGGHSAPAGALVVLLLVAGMAGSALTDQYLPERPQLGTSGALAWYAHQLRKPDGSCPTFANGGRCTSPRPQGALPPSADYATNRSPATFLQDCEYPWRKQRQ